MNRSFVTTRWSLVSLAARWRPGAKAASAEARAAQQALESLCAAYWPPLYACARRRGKSSQDAADLVQGLFASLLERRALDTIDPARGRFRSFLLTALQNFIANDHDRQRARKRGGDRRPVTFDVVAAEAQYERACRDQESPERSFERMFALQVMARALEQLRAEHAQAGKGETFARLQPLLTASDDAATCAEIARQLGFTEGAVRVAVHRLRRRYGELLRAEVAATVANPSEVDDEIRALLQALAS